MSVDYRLIGIMWNASRPINCSQGWKQFVQLNSITYRLRWFHKNQELSVLRHRCTTPIIAKAIRIITVDTSHNLSSEIECDLLFGLNKVTFHWFYSFWVENLNESFISANESNHVRTNRKKYRRMYFLFRENFQFGNDHQFSTLDYRGKKTQMQLVTIVELIQLDSIVKFLFCSVTCRFNLFIE